MSNVRFLDNVAVTSFAASNQLVGSTFPRVVFPGEIKTVFGTQTVYSHGLLRIETQFVNEGTISVDGILEIGDITI